MWDLKKDLNHFPARKANRILNMRDHVSKDNADIKEVWIKWFRIKMQFKPAA